ncbi:MAG: acyl-CoA dehydrogenase family protein [Isosphaeraceae bacterium]
MASTTAPVTPAQAEREKQMREAEELLFSGPQRSGFAKGLFQGKFLGPVIFPYPSLPVPDLAEAEAAAAQLRDFAASSIDPFEIDRQADIPPSVIDGLARLGVLGMTAPREFGGRGFSQRQYCRIMEVLGGHDAGVAVFVNAHHSIGIRALLLFGTPEQKARWLPDLCAGRKLGAFALTEEQAGSDAANVQTTATPSPDGNGWILNGTKRYITNGAIADVLTVMARTPDPRGGDSKVTAFLVTPDMPGFEVVEARMPKCGIRGTATAKLAFKDMHVPAENVLGQVGSGLKIALTVLNFGRTTFGASCTGAAKEYLRAAVAHAKTRRQFNRTLSNLEAIRKKIAYLSAIAYAMEAATIETAALIDSGADDYMLETAILKVFSTEYLWQGSYEVLQVHGGLGYFLDQPYERWMRDARINTIGEGANEVLKSFIAMVGVRDIAMGLKGTLDDVKSVTRAVPAILRFGGDHLKRTFSTPRVEVQSEALRPFARTLAHQVGQFGWVVERALMRYKEDILERQYVHERLADAAIALYVAACTLARLDQELSQGNAENRAAAELYLAMAARRVSESLEGMDDNDDEAFEKAAAACLDAKS